MAVTTIITNKESLSPLSDFGLLQLMQLTSPSLPIGGFAWSQGLEYAIDSGWLKNETETAEWLKGLIRDGLANLDIPILTRLVTACEQNDFEQLCYWNDYLLASRETSELHLEDCQMGLALKKLLVDLQIIAESDVPQGDVAYLTCFALAAKHHGIDRRSACIGFLWSWLENQIAAALKIFPLGQTAGQRIFHQLTETIVSATDHGLSVQGEAIGNSMPGQIMASMLHEEQYSRLFRS
ncbi:MAG: urease accessory protein UreF [Pseudomonadales bacterium]|nr:urease accessory protein UreF [Pseudomonadales bacterium]